MAQVLLKRKTDVIGVSMPPALKRIVEDMAKEKLLDLSSYIRVKLLEDEEIKKRYNEVGLLKK